MYEKAKFAKNMFEKQLKISSLNVSFFNSLARNS